MKTYVTARTLTPYDRVMLVPAESLLAGMEPGYHIYEGEIRAEYHRGIAPVSELAPFLFPR